MGSQEQIKTEWLRMTFQNYESRMVHYAWTILGDLESARDVAQDTFLKLCRQEPHKVGDPPAAWLYRVCRNRALDLYRQRKNRPQEPESLLNELPSQESDPSRDSESQEEKQGILQALRSLNDKEQEVVRLKFLHDLSYKEIADLTGLKTGNVGFILHSSLKKMRLILKEQAAATSFSALSGAPRL
jgi:RNA polymerase sigma-70 factor (ECF subfamily)